MPVALATLTLPDPQVFGNVSKVDLQSCDFSDKLVPVLKDGIKRRVLS